MKNLLMVDDEQITLDLMLSMLDWSLLDLQVYTATSVQQALTIIDNKNIDIVITDMEMPQGGGFALLESLSDDIVSVVVTCHDSFEYVRRAMRLGSMDYIVKPVQANALKQVIEAAVSRSDQILEKNTLLKNRQSLEKGRDEIKRAFFLNALNSFERNVYEEASKQDITVQPGEKYALVYLYAYFVPDSSGQPAKDEMIDSFSSHLNLCCKMMRSSKIFPLFYNRSTCLLLFENLSPEEIMDKCTQILELLVIKDQIKIGCYFSGMIYADKISQAYETLRKMHADNVAYFNCVLTADDKNQREAKLITIETAVWKSLIFSEQWEQAEEMINTWIDETVISGSMNKENAVQFFQIFTKMLYEVLERKGIKANNFVTAITQEDISHDDFFVIPKLKFKIHSLLRDTFRYETLMEKPQTLVERVSEYISEHLEEQMTCAEISAHFFYHSDYLTKLLKQESGLSLLDLYSKIRMNKACELLLQKDIPINNVAFKSGYPNVSHFTHMFHMVHGCTPSEYRKRHLSKK